MAFSGPVLGLVLLISFASAGNVLFGGMHASRSHVASMMPFALRLARENFSVHFMESYSGESYAYPPDVSPHLFKVPSNPVHKKQLTIAGWRRGFGPEVIGELFAIGDSAFLDMQRLHPKKMAQLLEKKWDLTVVDELFGISMYGIAAFHHNRSGTPYVVHSTTAILHVFAAKMGLGRPVFHRPSMWFPYNDNLRYDMRAFRMRLRSAVHALISAFCIDFLTQRFNVRGIKQIGVHHFDFHEAWTRLSYNFHDDLTNLAFPAPISNEIKYIGKYCPKANALSQEYREFLEDPRSKGTIFIAFGTNVDWAFAPKYVLDAFFDAIKQMTEYRVVFAYNGPNVTVGAHVKLVPWVPQVDILNHASTRLFVTHGGVKSLREALCSSTPLLVLPLAAEQTLNGAIAMELRVGHVLNKFTLSSKKLLASMRELLGSASYARNVARLHDLFLDRPISALDEAAFFARRAIRLGNRPATLKIRGAQLDWATALHLPFAALLVVLCFILSC